MPARVSFAGRMGAVSQRRGSGEPFPDRLFLSAFDEDTISFGPVRSIINLIKLLDYILFRTYAYSHTVKRTKFALPLNLHA